MCEKQLVPANMHIRAVVEENEAVSYMVLLYLHVYPKLACVRYVSVSLEVSMQVIWHGIVRGLSLKLPLEN